MTISTEEIKSQGDRRSHESEYRFGGLGCIILDALGRVGFLVFLVTAQAGLHKHTEQPSSII